MTKYSTICGVFQQPWPGVSPTAILNEEKALGMRLLPGNFLIGPSETCRIPWTRIGLPGRSLKPLKCSQIIKYLNWQLSMIIISLQVWGMTTNEFIIYDRNDHSFLIV